MKKMILTVFFLWIAIIKPTLAERNALHIPLHASMISFDPRKVQDTSSLWVARQTNCELVRMNKGTFTLDAAQSIRYISPIVIDIKLKRNLRFTNGAEVTAQDVIASFNYLREERSVLRNVFEWVDDMVLENKYEFLIKLKQSTPQLFTVLSALHYPIFEKKFIIEVSKNPSLWKEPVSCGDYKIDDSGASFIKLSPTKRKGLPIQFSLIPDSQLLAKDLHKYDLVSMQVMGKSNSLTDFNLINVFDPYQYYFILNTRISSWSKREHRCALFAKIDPKTVMSVYGDKVKRADDFLPSGTLGYVKDENYMEKNIFKFKNATIPSKRSFHVCFVATSIEKNYRRFYLDMIRKIYPNAIPDSINSYIDLNDELKDKKCDAMFFATKSNYLDAYEYFVAFSEQGQMHLVFIIKHWQNKYKRARKLTK